MAMNRQESWGWKVVVDIFAGGVGAGLFLASFLIERTSSPTELTNAGSIISPLLVLVGIFFLLMEVGKPANAYRAFLNFGTSWMARGVILQPILIVIGLLYALLPLGFPDLKTAPAGIIIGSLAALLALLVAVYYGLLFSQAKGIALWNNPLLPSLYFVSALAGGIGVLMLLSPFFTATADQMRLVATIEIALICVVLISMWLIVVVRPSTAYQASVTKLVTPSFVILTLAVGNVLPLILLASSLIVGGMMMSTVLLAIIGIMVLVGTYHLRHAITSAGHYYSLQIAF